MLIKLADRENADSINELRTRAYRIATNTKITIFSFLKWNEWDDKALVFYIENEKGNAVSSMRGLLVDDERSVEKVLDISLNTPVSFPALIIDRTTTLIQYRQRGFSAVLRYFLIRNCINSSVRNIITTVNDGVSRIPHLKEIGYIFEKADISNRRKVLFENTSDVLFGVLPHTHFSLAAKIAAKNLKTPLSFFTIDNQIIERMSNYLGQNMPII